MPERLFRNAREWFSWPVSARDDEGNPVTLTEVKVAFVRGDLTPPANATYLTIPVENGRARALLAGPDGAGGDAVALPLGKVRPWFLSLEGGQIIPRPAPDYILVTAIAATTF